MSGVGGERDRASAARDQLTAELERTVEAVSATIDEAAARADALARFDTSRLRRLSADLVTRALELESEIVALSEEADRVSALLRADPRSAGDGAGEPAPDAPRYADTTLDEIEATRAALAEPPARRRFLRRRPAAKGHTHIPEGVRLVVARMRLAGEPDAAIVNHLQQMGVSDPAGVLARFQP
ncbi:MAG TPA: hypothetical protein VID76_02220 [Solirubrobacterales bacterium]|jgi:hypothetical protein